MKCAAWFDSGHEPQGNQSVSIGCYLALWSVKESSLRGRLLCHLGPFNDQAIVRFLQVSAKEFGFIEAEVEKAGVWLPADRSEALTARAS
jgi:hypothetical protein